MTARQLFDQGATIGEVMHETGTSFTIAAHLCAPTAPKWPTLSPELLARLPEHLQRQIKASNPNHKAKP
jgi:hypothetical protein